MNIDVIPTLKELTPQKIYGKTAIVLDIFRCTSTIITALANGCREVIPARTSLEAKDLVSRYPSNSVVLAGETKGAKIPGFDLGNSPVEIAGYPILDKTLILSTTNGTEAIRSCKPAKYVLIGSFLNVSSTCTRAASNQKDTVIVCAGSEGNIALEDIMAAGCFVAHFKKCSQELRISDLSKTFYYLYKYFKNNLEQILLTSRSGQNLQVLGYSQDIFHCLKKDLYKIAPIYRNNAVHMA